MPNRCVSTFRIFLCMLMATLLVAMWPREAEAADDSSSTSLTLAQDGKTTYRIVKPHNPTPVDTYAINALAENLKRSTGAIFEIIDPSDATSPGQYIFVGISHAAVGVLGDSPLDSLADQEHIARSAGDDIYLYGKGVHGNLYAVFEFLENSLGWRWYTVAEEAVVPARPDLVLQPFDRKRSFDFKYRQTGLRWGLDFYYQHGLNLGYYAYQRNRAQRFDHTMEPQYVSTLASTNFVHTLHSYIPPSPDAKYAKEFAWQDKFNYFETNPEFFSLDERGQRVANKQLCLSNAALRAELTRNVLRDIEHARQFAKLSQGIIVTVDAADTPGTFCYCEHCLAVEKKYQSHGGPLFDYLIELCETLKRDQPDVFVRTLAYRRSQTQKAPVLSGREMLPENLIVAFAPIEDNYFADWTHPDSEIQETLADLKAWKKITHHLWAWIYPNPWGSGALMPVGNVQRMITNIRIMHEAGVEGLFADHNGFIQRSGWAELQAYLMYKLMQDVDADTDALTREFLAHMYGDAGSHVHVYLHELEKERKALMQLPPRVTYASRVFDDETFPYLTPPNIHRWQGYFEQMLEQVEAGSREHDNIRLLRRELDLATLNRWEGMQTAYPQAYAEYEAIIQRIGQANTIKTPRGFLPRPVGVNHLKSLELKLKTAGQEKPLPEQFAEIPKHRIRTFMPTTKRNRTLPREDADAPFGFAPRVDGLMLPFQMGAYSWTGEEAGKRRGEHGPRVKIERDQITPGQYKLYHLGEFDMLTQESILWFGRSWQTSAEVGFELYRPGEENKWDVYVELKFDGPLYGGTASEDEVLVGRIIMIDQSTN